MIKVLRKEYKTPFIQKLKDETDLRYFDDNFTQLSLDSEKPEEKKDIEAEKDEYKFECFSYQQKDGTLKVNENLSEND